MRRLTVVAVVALFIGAVAIAALVLARSDTAPAAGGSSDGAYASKTQTRAERVPGSLDLQLAPPPEDFAASVTPDAAFRRAFESPPRGEVTRTLAVMQDTLNSSGGTAGAPAWIFFVRGVCYPQDKGDTVSAARSGLDSPCGDDDLAVTTVDASGTDDVMSFVAVDLSEEWRPANAEPLVLAAADAVTAKR